MSPWFLLAAVAAVALAAGAAVIATRRRRRARLYLRVLAGRRRLLGEEIATRLDELSTLTAAQDDSARQAVGAAANRMIDAVHAGLVEREAHLQILEELARLQRHKLAVLAHRRGAGASAVGVPGAPAAEAEPPAQENGDPEGDEGGILERRERLQDSLLEQIEKRRPGPRRRGR